MIKKTYMLIRVILLSFILCASAAANGRVETVQFRSKLVNATLPYNVILPTDYDTARTTRYPVLYLLHGLTGHFSDWVTRTNIANYASEYRMIIITPEGNDSWYVDEYEAYILDELIPEVQKRYRTIEARHGRSIAGLSMGGYGAIKFGLKWRAVFVFAGSMSGAFSVTRLSEEQMREARWGDSLKLFGAAGSEKRLGDDLFALIEKIPPARANALPYFYFDCGTEDSPLIFLSNRELATFMVEKKIPHEFRQLPGDHSWVYWDRQVQEVLKIAASKMRVRPAKGSTWHRLRTSRA
jgi:S-formylglutathione hydrolase FrmB